MFKRIILVTAITLTFAGCGDGGGNGITGHDTSGSGAGSRTTLTFTGTVTSTVDIAEVAVGAQVTGHYTFDSLATDEIPDNPKSGLYPASQFSISVAGFEWSAADNNISVIDDAMGLGLGSPFDWYEVVSPLGKVSGPNLSGLAPAQFQFNIVDTDASVFSDDSLPTLVNVAEFEITSEFPDRARGGSIAFRSLAAGQTGIVFFEMTGTSSEGTP